MRALATVVVVLAIGCLRGENTSSLNEAKDFEVHGVAVWQCQCPAYGAPVSEMGPPCAGRVIRPTSPTSRLGAMAMSSSTG
jgi:hypothetical protein